MPEIEHLKGKIGGGDFEKLRDLLNRNADVFSKHKADIGCCNFVEHEIELEEGAVPHREGARRMKPHKLEACRAEIEMLLEYDMIEPSKLPWACGVVMAKKKGGQLRFCCDFRSLNLVTIKDAYPIPRIDESLSKLGDAKFFTTLDLSSAFWQVPLRKKDREKTGFACELGLNQWKRMPFGLCNATATFQRLMAQALTRVTKKYGNLVMCYVDDVVIATPTLEDHIDRLDEVFGCMKRAGLKCKPSKCEILRDSIKYLGRMVDRHGVRPDPETVEAVLTWKAPRTDTQLLSFLGFANYYREFIKGYADKVYPMQKLMRNKGKKFEWNDEAQVAFENIKRELCEAPVLDMPIEKGMYVLDTDASVVVISGILHQEQEWNGRTVLRPIAYGSKVLSDTEMKYGAPKAEMFAVVTFVEKYRAYLGSAPFKLRVDNRALSWLKTYSMDQSYIGRWIVRLDGYHMIIEHRMRDKHQNADSLSKKTEFCERLEQKQANQAEIKEGFSFLDKETYEEKDLENRVLSGEFRWMRRRHRHDLEERAVSSATSSTDDNSRNSGMDTYSDRNSSSGSELSELAIHTLLVETRARDMDREVYQDPDSDRYLIPSERVFDNAADDLETIPVSKRSISLLPQKEVVRTDLQPFKQETQPLAKI